MEQALDNFRQGVRGYARRIGLPAFWQWWVGELARIVPAASRAAVKRRLVQPVLAFDRGAAALLVPRARDDALVYEERARISCAGDPAEVEKAGRAALELARRELNGGTSPEFRVLIVSQASVTKCRQVSLLIRDGSRDGSRSSRG